ncbi:MAG: hypothetical protein H0T53_14140 [Herpetosiphonaceae bacterium]|nr:hypothetical protein [Herpetosiphonaceae bacterium]
MKARYKICIISSWNELTDFITNQLAPLDHDIQISNILFSDLNTILAYDILFLYIEDRYLESKINFITKIRTNSEFLELTIILIAPYTKEILSKIVNSDINYYDQIMFLPVSDEGVIGSLELGTLVKNRRLRSSRNSRPENGV